MLREIVLVSLVVFTVPVDLATISDCPNGTLSSDTLGRSYIVEENGSLFCPDTDATMWFFMSCNNLDGQEGTTGCTTGTFASLADLSSNSSCFDQSSSPACVLTEGPVSSLIYCPDDLTAESGTLNFVYMPSGGTPLSFRVEYAPIGILLLEDSNVISAAVGSMVEVVWRVRRFSGAGDEYKLFFVTSDKQTLLYGDEQMMNSSLTGVSIMPTLSECRNSIENRLPSDFMLTISSVNSEHAGVYILDVVIVDDKSPSMTNFSFSSSVTLNVLPSATHPIPSSSAPTGSLGNSATTTAIVPSTSPTDAGPDGPSLLVVIIAAGVVGAIILIVAVPCTLLVCCWRCRRERADTSLENPPKVQQNGSPQKYNKRNSVASDRPLVTTPSPNLTPTTVAPDDYVSLYYEQEFANTFKIIKHKHPDRFRELTSIDDMILIMTDPHCIEIIAIVNLKDSPLFKEMITRGVQEAERSKIKFVHFGKNSTPGYNLEMQGYRMVVLEGDPQEEETFSELVTKLELPIFRKAPPSPINPHRRMSSDPIPATLPEVEERPQQGRSETDFHPPASARVNSGTAATETRTLIELQQAMLEETKKNTEILIDISKSSAKTEQNTGGLHETVEMVLVKEGEPSSTPPLP